MVSNRTADFFAEKTDKFDLAEHFDFLTQTNVKDRKR
jgi:hypothetical protein